MQLSRRVCFAPTALRVRCRFFPVLTDWAIFWRAYGAWWGGAISDLRFEISNGVDGGTKRHRGGRHLASQALQKAAGRLEACATDRDCCGGAGKRAGRMPAVRNAKRSAARRRKEPARCPFASLRAGRRYEMRNGVVAGCGWGQLFGEVMRTMRENKIAKPRR